MLFFKALKLKADLALFHCVPSSHVTLLPKLDYKKLELKCIKYTCLFVCLNSPV